MAKFLFTLCHQFMKSFWNLSEFYMVFRALCLDWQDAFRRPLGLGQRLQEADGPLSLQEGWIHLHTCLLHHGLELGIYYQRWAYLKSQPKGKCYYSHCMCEIFAQLQASREPQWGRRAAGWIPKSPETSGHLALRAELKTLRPWSQLRDEWGSSCSHASSDDIAVAQMALNSYARLQGNSESHMPRVRWKSTGKVSLNTHILLSMHGYQS